MSASNITLVVGGSRGIGKELVTQLANASASNQVIASVRKPVDFGLENVQSIILDQTSTESVEKAAANVKEVDTLIINGAIGDDELMLSTSEKRLLEYLDTNVVGVLRIVKAFLPALKARATRQIVFISSTSGSNALQIDCKIGFRGPYSVTKAAGNMMMIQLHNELHEKEGFTVVSVHPGWVATDMGNIAGEGGMAPADSARDILKLVKGLKSEDSAKFYLHDGSIAPW